MSAVLKPGVILFIITVVAAALLGAANVATREVIAKNTEKARGEAMKKVLPDATDFDKDVSVKNNDVTSYVRGVNSGNNTVGYVFTVTAKGYSSAFDVYVGIAADGTISGIALGENSETPGLGKKAEGSQFTDQYVGKGSSKKISVVKGTAEKDNEIAAITAATITSKGVTEAVNAAVEFYMHVPMQTGGEK